MSDLYIALLEITSSGISEIANEKININYAYRYCGFEFRILYSDEEFFQLSVYEYNTYTTRVLLASLENSGKKVGGKYNVPLIFETDGGFAGVLCTYIFVVSKSQIYLEQLYQNIGIDGKWDVTEESYRRLRQNLYDSERTIGFFELMNYIEKDDDIRYQTDRMTDNTLVYNEQFYSRKKPNKTGAIVFKENLTLLSAKKAVMSGKHTAILNFANPVEHGGGVLRGAKAQEENICRSSNLYKALSSKNAHSYYNTNKSILEKNQFNSMFLGSDMVIYSPDVMVLKEDVDYEAGYLYSGNEKYINDPFYIDVITCAAPFFSGLGYILPNGDLQHVFERRIRNILEVAIENETEVIVLGAFGCGAFHNPPEVVAEAFRTVLLEKRYKKAFDGVIFAVQRTDIFCPNIEAFEKAFSIFPYINLQGNEHNRRITYKNKEM